ncbi:glycosyltransferase family 4 protein [Jatrophihabitans sp. DSM 45814]
MTGLEIPRTVVVTGHFPPETGGVQTFTWEFVRRLPAEQLIVIAPAWSGAAQFDARLPFPVIRRHGYLLFRDLPHIVAEHRAEVGWITAMAPFGLYAPLLRRAGLSRLVGSTHGQELGWLRAWPTRLAFGRMAASVDTMTYLSEATRAQLDPVVHGRTNLDQLAGGTDIDRFHPGAGGRRIRERYGFGDDPVVVSVGRLVRRKGFDVLMQAWPEVRRMVPRARLLIVGDGPMLKALRSFAAEQEPGSVVVTGPVTYADLPAHYDCGTVFVLACRDDRGGLQTEGLGLSVLEASASGLPVVVGKSGGSAASVQPGKTGLLIDARMPERVAMKLVGVLASGGQGHVLGEAGRRWVTEQWTWPAAAQRLAAILRGEKLANVQPEGGPDLTPVLPQELSRRRRWTYFGDRDNPAGGRSA